MELHGPRVNDRRHQQGQRQRLVAAVCRPTEAFAEVLPILYLLSLSTGDFRPALEGLLGVDAAGLSPTNISRLTPIWE